MQFPVRAVPAVFISLFPIDLRSAMAGLLLRAVWCSIFAINISVILENKISTPVIKQKCLLRFLDCFLDFLFNLDLILLAV